MKKPKILVVAESSVAYLMQMSDLPGYGEAVCENRLYRIPSGSGNVISMFLAKMGMVPYLCTSIAKDENGDILLRFLYNNKINPHYVYSVDGESTGIDFIIADSAMQYRYIKYCCANSLLDEEFVREAIYSSNTDAVFLQLSMPQKVVHTVLKECKKSGKPIYLYTGFGQIAPLPDNMQSYTNIKMLVTDAKGSEMLCGCGNFLESSQVSSFLSLARTIPAEQYLVRLSNGTVLAYNNSFRDMVTHNGESKRRDTVSSFDTLFASAAASYILNEKQNFRGIARFSQAVETLTAAGIGGALSCPDFNNITQYLEEKNIQINFD